ncbi:hypothetical protein [Chitinophaga sp. HK235]|uniref:hypothetical protein n=1 Tax=Chitinophaga sp. HK235 TaxID=2952571 RepID=UPI001BA994E0|nr:hypothetical protein [Chitinophaga sp. HK235]
MGAYTYVRGTSSQTSGPSGNGNTITAIAASTVGTGGSYGVFSGSALTITFYSNLGEGKYTLGNTEMMVASPAAKIISISCTIGTAVNTGAVLYAFAGGASAVTVDVTKDSNGKYHISMPAGATLTKKVVVQGGIADAKDTYELTINNVY